MTGFKDTLAQVHFDDDGDVGGYHDSPVGGDVRSIGGVGENGKLDWRQLLDSVGYSHC